MVLRKATKRDIDVSLRHNLYLHCEEKTTHNNLSYLTYYTA